MGLLHDLIWGKAVNGGGSEGGGGGGGSSDFSEATITVVVLNTDKPIFGVKGTSDFYAPKSLVDIEGYTTEDIIASKSFEIAGDNFKVVYVPQDEGRSELYNLKVILGPADSIQEITQISSVSGALSYDGNVIVEGDGVITFGSSSNS